MCAKVQQPLVSVIVISKNCKDIIRRCLDSIFAQTYKNIEVVVIDSSNDETTSVIEEYQRRSPFPFRIIHQEPKGVGAARNAGILNAKGEVVVFVDSDAWISHNCIEEIAKHYAKSDNILCVRTKEVIARPTGLFPRLVDLYDRIMVRDMISNEFKGLNPLMPRKKLYEIVGLYDETLKSGADAALYNRVKNKFDELKKQGYQFEYIPSATISEEKQGLSFFEYFKRCIWYGEPLANPRYVKSDILTNTIKLLTITYFAILPLLLVISFVTHLNLVYILASLMPFIFLYAYIILRSIKTEYFTWLVFLMPVLLFYKNVGLFVGFIKGLLSKL